MSAIWPTDVAVPTPLVLALCRVHRQPNAGTSGRRWMNLAVGKAASSPPKPEPAGADATATASADILDSLRVTVSIDAEAGSAGGAGPVSGASLAQLFAQAGMLFRQRCQCRII